MNNLQIFISLTIPMFSVGFLIYKYCILIVGGTIYIFMKTPVSILIVGCFLLTSLVGPMAQADDFRLPAPGVQVNLSPSFNPMILKGIKVHPDNPFRFDFILDKGDSRASNNALKDETSKLIKYFLASLTIPEKDLWVNLSPYEKDRIIPPTFGLTEMGRDLLAEDYMLKQIAASLIYPENAIGRKFWKLIYEEAAKKFGTTDIPMNTFNKVWIVPQRAVVYENAKEGTAYVVESSLKVMLEQDYLSLEKHGGIQSHTTQTTRVNQLGSQIVHEIIIPQLTKEVNEDKNFSRLRQVYNSLILATWYKKKIKDSILTQVYANRNKVAGVNIEDPKEKQRIYQRYLQAFKRGVFNYIKEEDDPISQEKKPRKYFSGGFNFAMLGSTYSKADGAMRIEDNISSGDIQREEENPSLIHALVDVDPFRPAVANVVGKENPQDMAMLLDYVRTSFTDYSSEMTLLSSEGINGGSPDGSVHRRYRDKNGDIWLFKSPPMARWHRVLVEGVGSQISQRIGLSSAVKIFVGRIGNEFGTFSQWIDTKKGDSSLWKNLTHDGIEGLSRDQLIAIVREHPLDWLIANHDAHSGHFMKGTDGQLHTIDKGQAYKYFGSPTEELSTTYNPNFQFNGPTISYVPIYNLIWVGLREGRFKGLSTFDEAKGEVLKVIASIEKISDQEFLNDTGLRRYAQMRFDIQGTSNHESMSSAQFIAKALQRKNHIRADFEKFFHTLKPVSSPESLFNGRITLDTASGQIKLIGNQPIVPLAFTLIADRHGRTPGNLRDFQGHSDDSYLNELIPQSKKDAQIAAGVLLKALKPRLYAGEKIVIVRSPLKRARSEAAPFIALLKQEGYKEGIHYEFAPSAVDAGAIERDYGVWDMKMIAELPQAEKEKALRYRIKADNNVRPLNGESNVDLILRVKAWLDNLNGLYKGRTVVVFGHARHLSVVSLLAGSIKGMVNPITRLVNFQGFTPAHSTPFQIKADSYAMISSTPVLGKEVTGFRFKQYMNDIIRSEGLGDITYPLGSAPADAFGHLYRASEIPAKVMQDRMRHLNSKAKIILSAIIRRAGDAPVRVLETGPGVGVALGEMYKLGSHVVADSVSLTPVAPHVIFKRDVEEILGMVLERVEQGSYQEIPGFAQYMNQEIERNLKGIENGKKFEEMGKDEKAQAIGLLQQNKRSKRGELSQLSMPFPLLFVLQSAGFDILEITEKPYVRKQYIVNFLDDRFVIPDTYDFIHDDYGAIYHTRSLGKALQALKPEGVLYISVLGDLNVSHQDGFVMVYLGGSHVGPVVLLRQESKIFQSIQGSLENKGNGVYESEASQLVQGIGESHAMYSTKPRNDLANHIVGKGYGGIDLSSAHNLLISQKAGEGIKFHLDYAMLKQLQNASGFVPVIISIQPMVNLRKFLGVT